MTAPLPAAQANRAPGPPSASPAASPDERRLRAWWEEAGPKVRLRDGGSDELSTLVRHHRASHAESEPLVQALIRPGRRILDIYFGAGLDAVDAAAAGARATFVSPVSAHARMTRELARRRQVDVDVVVGSPTSLPFATGQFDAVLARGALMFASDPARVVDEAARVLRPGGTLVAVLYNRRSWYPLMRRLYGAPMLDAGDPPFLHLETRRSAAGLFTQFAEVDLRHGRYPVPLENPTGPAERLFNRVAVPAFNLLPRPLMEKAGFYLIVRAVRPE